MLCAVRAEHRQSQTRPVSGSPGVELPRGLRAWRVHGMHEAAAGLDNLTGIDAALGPLACPACSLDTHSHVRVRVLTKTRRTAPRTRRPRTL
jgi:hypothetical protein